MLHSTIRVSEGLLGTLRQLKEVSGASSYEEVLGRLAHEELMKTHAFTIDGYFPVGTVVESNPGYPLVIKSIAEGKVVFTDLTYVINASHDCYHLRFLADGVENYRGGRLHA